MSAPRRRRAEAAGGAARLSRSERRRQLLAHARHLFASAGYRETTWAMLAEAAGVTEAALARQFPTKAALLEGLLADLRAAAAAAWRQACADHADPLGRLHALAEWYLGSARAFAKETRIVLRSLADGDGEEVALLRELLLEAESALARVIVEGQQSGVFRRSLDPRVGAWELLRGALGHALAAPVAAPLFAESGFLARSVDCLLHCLLKTDV
jgi:AcrR family transcriptional regulator